MTTLGIIIGNRGFFPAHLCESGRREILQALAKEDIQTVALDAGATPYGAIESLDDAERCAELLRQHAGKLDGILVTLPNFGDERAIANALRWSGLNVPVLVHAFEDAPREMSAKFRRDSFCGKMSVCNNLRQHGIKYSLTDSHTVAPGQAEFRAELRRFAAVCRIVRKLKHCRIGAIGARPGAFNTVRYSEKLLERSGITVETLDLSEVLGRSEKLAKNDAAVREKLAAIQAYTTTEGVPADALLRMARLGVVIDRWIKEQRLDATALQCWTALEEFYGVVPCTLMSMLSQNLLPSGCETDVTGVVGMLALQAASGTPSALLDWNNNFGREPDKGVLFHCSNLAKCFFCKHKMDYQAIIAGTVGKENTHGTLAGRIAAGPFTYCRVSTDDLAGTVKAYVGEGDFTADKLETFGGYGVIKVPRFQKLLQHICREGFEHHVATTQGSVAPAIAEAFGTYLGWPVYHHGAESHD